jgi:hypothetical protein
MANHQLYNHCDVVTTVDKEENTVHVEVSYKAHVLESSERFLYTAGDVLSAVCQSGIPVAEVLAGHANTLNNRTTLYTSSNYVFSLIPKKAAEAAEAAEEVKEVAENPSPKTSIPPKRSRKPRKKAANPEAPTK